MEINSTPLKHSLSQIIRRYHMIIFSIVVLGGLIACVMLINAVVAKSGDLSSYNTTAPSSIFDKDTIQRVNKLHSTADNAPDDLDLSNGRTNPFVE